MCCTWCDRINQIRCDRENAQKVADRDVVVANVIEAAKKVAFYIGLLAKEEGFWVTPSEQALITALDDLERTKP